MLKVLVATGFKGKFCNFVHFRNLLYYGYMTEKGLSGNALKVIAIVAMTIDHLAWVGIETYEQAETPTQIFLHCIGRLTAPR